MNTPRLRFKEFDVEWKEIPLKNTVNPEDRYSFTGGPFGSDLKSSDYTANGVRIIQLQNIGDGYFNNSYKIFTTEDKADQLKSCNIYPGEIIISKMADPLARAAIMPDFDSRYLMASDGIRLSVNKDLFSNYFIFEYINHSIFRKKAELNSTGTTRKRIGLVTLGSLTLKIPEKLEQEKIADFLFLLNTKIQKQQQKVQLLKQQKKGLMQKIFSQELRFKDENGQDYPNWNEQALGNIGTTYTGLSGKNKDDFGFGEHSFITYTNVFNNLYAKLEQIEKVSVKDEERQSYVERNDILFTTSSETPNEVGMASIWIHDSKNLHLNSFCFGYRIITEDINPEFVAISLRSDYMRKKIVFLAQGSTRYNISKAKLMEATIKIPTFKEQNKIIAFYKKLDSQVKLEEERQKFLIAQKQGFMQLMFT